MNRTTGIIIAILAVLAVGYLVIMKNGSTNTDNGSSVSQTQKSNTSNTQGRVVFSVADPAIDMNSISEINMTVSKVEMHSATQGWITASDTPQTYNLLELNAKNESKLMADIKMNTGTYDQVRLAVDSIYVKTKTGGTTEAKLPSGVLKINTTVVVNADKTSSVNFDFMSDKSLHITGNGSYIFAPVVKTQVKSDADVNVNIDNVVSINNGKVTDEHTDGMDVDGSVKLNFQIDNGEKLNLDSNNKIKVNGLLNY